MEKEPVREPAQKPMTKLEEKSSGGGQFSKPLWP